MEPTVTCRAGRIDFTRVSGAQVALFSLQGKRKKMFYPQNDNLTMTTTDLPAGSYLVTIRTSDGNSKTEKIYLMN